MSSRSGSKDHHLEDLPLEDDNRFIADDNQNIDDMIDLITKKTVETLWWQMVTRRLLLSTFRTR